MHRSLELFLLSVMLGAIFMYLLGKYMGWIPAT